MTPGRYSQEGPARADRPAWARGGNAAYVLADSSKLGLRPFHAWARLALPWTLVTDDGTDPNQVRG